MFFRDQNFCLEKKNNNKKRKVGVCPFFFRLLCVVFLKGRVSLACGMCLGFYFIMDPIGRKGSPKIAITNLWDNDIAASPRSHSPLNYLKPRILIHNSETTPSSFLLVDFQFQARCFSLSFLSDIFIFIFLTYYLVNESVLVLCCID